MPSLSSELSFAELADEFHARVERIVWCSVATQDRQGRLRSRLLHPIWEKPTGEAPFGWILTNRNSLKAKHLAENPWITCSYWDPQHEQVYVDAKAAWQDDPERQQEIWDDVKSRPEPYGYDPAIIWADGPEDPVFGVLELRPWRVELYALADMMSGKGNQVWRSGE